MPDFVPVESCMKARSNFIWLLGERVFRLCIGVGVGIFVARYLGPRQFGIYSYAMAVSGLLTTFVVLGLPPIVVRDLVRTPRRTSEILGTALTLQHIASILAMISCLSVSIWLHNDSPSTQHCLMVLCLAALLKPAELTKCWFEAQIASKRVVMAEAVGLVTGSVIRICLAIASASLIAFAWATLIELTVAALGLVVAFWTAPQRPAIALKFDFDAAKAQLRDAWPLTLSGIAIAVYMRIDQIMLEHLADSGTVGIYTSAVRISEMWYFVPAALLASVNPYLVKAASINEAEYMDRIAKLCSVLAVGAIVIAVVVTAFAGLLIGLLYGDDYIGAANILRVHIWAGVFVSLGLAASNWFVVKNLGMLSLWRTLFGALLNIALNLWMIPWLGGLGAAIATLISQAFASVLINAIDARTRQICVTQLKSLAANCLVRSARMAASHMRDLLTEPPTA